MVRRLAGSAVEERDDYLVVRTPQNPVFYWGNFLLVPGSAAARNGKRWLRMFAAEFPDAGHVAIGVDGTDGRLGADAVLRAAGLEPEVSTVLVADDLATTPRREDAAVVRPLVPEADDDWVRLAELELAIAEAPDDLHRRFVEGRTAEIRELVRERSAIWCAAFVDGMLCASAGLVTDGSGLGRFQLVQTHPGFRRRGFAGRVLAISAAVARRELGVGRFVIVADPSYVAIDLYRRLGFTPVEQQVQWQRGAE